MNEHGEFTSQPRTRILVPEVDGAIRALWMISAGEEMFARVTYHRWRMFRGLDGMKCRLPRRPLTDLL